MERYVKNYDLEIYDIRDLIEIARRFCRYIVYK